MIKMRVFGLCAVSAASLMAVATAYASTASASPHAIANGAQGGYVAAPAHLHSARLEVRVPVVHCAASPDRSVRIGIFGHTRRHGRTSPWFAAVTSACRSGRAHYGAAFGEGATTASTGVHPGDLIRIVVQRGPSPSYEFDDLTNGSGSGGGSSALPGQVTVPTVVLGARRTGSAFRLDLAISRCAVNGKPISALHHHRQRQVIDHRVVVDPTALMKRGTAFGLAIR